MSTLKARIAVVAISAVGIASVANFEGFRDKAYIPVPGDRPTIGYGSTYNADGSPVKMGETITKERAQILLKKTMTSYEAAVKRCAPYDMYQYEFDAYVSFTYNLGEGRFCKSLIPRKLSEHDYAGACKEILRYDMYKGSKLKGLTIRRKEEYDTCVGNKEPKEPEEVSPLPIVPSTLISPTSAGVFWDFKKFIMDTKGAK